MTSYPPADSELAQDAGGVFEGLDCCTLIYLLCAVSAPVAFWRVSQETRASFPRGRSFVICVFRESRYGIFGASPEAKEEVNLVCY